MSSNDPGTLIRITKEEAASSHVDDLLKRQMSLRGDPGVTRDRGHRRWFYQNWFVFSLVGGIGAFLAWALLEPHFDDNLYIQGPISNLELSTARTLNNFDLNTLDNSFIRGSMTINGEHILLPRRMWELNPDGTKKKLNPTSLNEGDTVGVYVEYMRTRDDSLGLAEFIVRSPSRPPKHAGMTLDQLHSRSRSAGLLLFPVVAGMVGLFIGAVDGLICRLPKRALFAGSLGLLVGFVGGFVSGIAAEIVYAPLTMLAAKQMSNASSGLNTFGFVLQMVGRSLAWGMAGLAMGLAQGIFLRSKRLLLYGLIGGVVGGLFGGFLFDPIDLLLLGPDKPSSHWSRLIGFCVIGISVGAMIGIVELLARDAWLRMTQGPLSGKEFLLFKDVMNIGASPRSDVYLFNDAQVAENHAIIRAVGDECEIEARQSNYPVLLNHRAVQRGRLRHGDNVTIGRTSFIFQRRKG